MVRTEEQKSNSNDKNGSNSWNTGPVEKRTVGDGTTGTVEQ